MPARRGSRSVLALVCLVAALAVAGAYSNAFQNGFHFDDSHVIEGNLYIRSLGNIPRFFRDASTFSALPSNATYRPLVSTTLAIDYWLGGGLNPRYFHTTQIALLLVLGILLYALARRLFEQAAMTGPQSSTARYAALVAATLFCVHTANTETMNAIAARSELLSTIGVLGSFLMYIALPGSRRLHLYLMPMIVGALAKTPAVMFAPMLVVYLFLFEQELPAGASLSARGAAARAALWKGLPALVVGAVAFVAINAQNAPEASWGGGDRVHYLYTQLFAWLHYARLFFLPIGLTADTDWRLITEWYDTRVVVGAGFVAGLTHAMWRASNQPEWRPVAFGLAWFVLALLPASSVVPLAEVVNEHRVFFPFVGASIAAVWTAMLLVARAQAAWPARHALLHRGAIATATLVVAAFAIGTYERNKIWLNEETLWRDVTEKSPGNGRGLMNYGLTQMAKGRYVEAKALFDRAQTSLPNYPTLEVNLAIVTDRLGDKVTAEQHFARALQLNPNYPAAHSFYARWLLERSRVEDAIPHLEQAVVLSPASVDARYQLMDAYARAGRADALKAAVAETLRVVPGDARARAYLDENGEVVLAAATPGGAPANGGTPNAVAPVSSAPASAVPNAAASAAPARIPAPPTGSMPGDLLNVSLRRYQQRDFEGCIETARQVLALDPRSAEAYNNIAAASAELQRWDEAIAAAREALRLRPDLQLAKNNLAWAEQGKRNGAPK